MDNSKPSQPPSRGRRRRHPARGARQNTAIFSTAAFLGLGFGIAVQQGTVGSSLPASTVPAAVPTLATAPVTAATVTPVTAGVTTAAPTTAVTAVTATTPQPTAATAPVFVPAPPQRHQQPQAQTGGS